LLLQARAFGRLAGSEPSLLNSTIMLAERAVALQPGNADYVSVLWGLAGPVYLLPDGTENCTPLSCRCY
jgi:hypothetical protein